MTDSAPFQDRTDAGERLAALLGRFRGTSLVLLALPDGGVTVGLPIARALGLPLALAWEESPLRHHVRREVTARIRTEGYGTGSLFDFGGSSGRRGAELVSAEVATATDHAAATAATPEVQDRDVLLIDDGLHSDQEVHATLRSLRSSGPASLALVTPFITQAAADHHDSEVDEIFALRVLESLGAASEQYVDPTPPSLIEERRLLGKG
jgi:putative phosphoribosyl transferase